MRLLKKRSNSEELRESSLPKGLELLPDSSAEHFKELLRLKREVATEMTARIKDLNSIREKNVALLKQYSSDCETLFSEFLRDKETFENQRLIYRQELESLKKDSEYIRSKSWEKELKEKEAEIESRKEELSKDTKLFDKLKEEILETTVDMEAEREELEQRKKELAQFEAKSQATRELMKRLDEEKAERDSLTSWKIAQELERMNNAQMTVSGLLAQLNAKDEFLKTKEKELEARNRRIESQQASLKAAFDEARNRNII
jgi:chromosome segregation ATPase